jgi:hypothetical protein
LAASGRGRLNRSATRVRLSLSYRGRVPRARFTFSITSSATCWRGGDDGQGTALLDVAGGTEEALRTLRSMEG